MHTAPFSSDDATTIAEAVVNALFLNDQMRRFFDLSVSEVSDIVHDSNLIWAPDGDEAFDDGSYVLQFDIGERVRLIAFQKIVDSLARLRDVSLSANEFYRILQDWRDAFEAEWKMRPKSTPSSE